MVRINDIHCIETDTLSWAKAERFNGKSGGYAMINAKHSLEIQLAKRTICRVYGDSKCELGMRHPRIDSALENQF